MLPQILIFDPKKYYISQKSLCNRFTKLHSRSFFPQFRKRLDYINIYVKDYYYETTQLNIKKF